jgi:hypothetical protein
MHKFKVGDKVVVGTAGAWFIELFQSALGVREYYTITHTSAEGYWLQLDGIYHYGDPVPWCSEYFELYQEPDDELPPVPDSVYYPDMYTLLTGIPAVGGTSGLTARKSPYTSESISLSIDGSKWTRLDADAALQLAHDLRRMAMKIKREQK